MKLQDAYAAETNALGTWTVIGYVGPGTQAKDAATGAITGSSTPAFTYSGGATVSNTTCTTGSKWNGTKCAGEGENPDGTVTGSAITKGWIAHNNAQLNNCAPGDHWDVSASTGTTADNTGSVTYTHTVLTADCEQLTPQFANIGR